MKKCSRCNSKFSWDKQFCPICGGVVVDVPDAVVVPAKEEQGKKTFLEETAGREDAPAALEPVQGLADELPGEAAHPVLKPLAASEPEEPPAQPEPRSGVDWQPDSPSVEETPPLEPSERAIQYSSPPGVQIYGIPTITPPAPAPFELPAPPAVPSGFSASVQNANMRVLSAPSEVQPPPPIIYGESPSEHETNPPAPPADMTGSVPSWDAPEPAAAPVPDAAPAGPAPGVQIYGIPTITPPVPAPFEPPAPSAVPPGFSASVQNANMRVLSAPSSEVQSPPEHETNPPAPPADMTGSVPSWDVPEPTAVPDAAPAGFAPGVQIYGIPTITPPVPAPFEPPAPPAVPSGFSASVQNANMRVLSAPSSEVQPPPPIIYGESPPEHETNPPAPPAYMTESVPSWDAPEPVAAPDAASADVFAPSGPGDLNVSKTAGPSEPIEIVPAISPPTDALPTATALPEPPIGVQPIRLTHSKSETSARRGGAGRYQVREVRHEDIQTPRAPAAEPAFVPVPPPVRSPMPEPPAPVYEPALPLTRQEPAAASANGPEVQPLGAAIYKPELPPRREGTAEAAPLSAKPPIPAPPPPVQSVASRLAASIYKPELLVPKTEPAKAGEADAIPEVPSAQKEAQPAQDAPDKDDYTKKVARRLYDEPPPESEFLRMFPDARA
ncbi:MAG: hypothetical protein LBS75_03935 [Synergistaceae bacterium]|nr:hypothetical protein [Synergistaceae bacterium]